ncbi:MAG: biotin/lipoyl-binding protein [Thiopseudomonas sp.]|nr:biotin/lipoyl-binding protein [Thiopseudomonas sp.]MCK9465496.1 biotin/lipoyl-binding protein [Thiopseudomonas sp.]
MAKSEAANLLFELEARARAATNLAELCFSIANDSHGLLPFRQAMVFSGNGRDSRLHTVSGLTKLSEDSPYLLWLKRIWPRLQEYCQQAPAWLTPQVLVDEPAELHEGWQEWWPEGLYALPIKRRDGEVLGWVCFLLDKQPTETQHRAMVHMLQSWGYAWEMLAGKPRRGLRKRWQGLSKTRRRVLIVALGIVPFIPVRQSYLAPAEVIAMDAAVVAAPMDGVIKSLAVRPNQPVKIGDVLFVLDDTVLRNRQAVLSKSVAVADAELMANTQRAFDDMRSKGELTMLAGRAQERRAELASVQEQLSRTVIRASHEGIAVFADPDDWLGRPVSTGERIMQVANPSKPGVLIEVPVADAMVLHEGAPVKLFLTVRPLSPLRASVVQSSYQAYLSDERIASYRLRAEFTELTQDARIGLRGTAKVYGNWTVLGYYLMRRPLASLRELTGW